MENKDDFIDWLEERVPFNEYDKSENFLNEDWDLIDFEKLAEGGDLPIEEPVDGAIDITLDFGDMCPFTSIRVCLYYGDFNLPLPSATFEVKADSCLNVLKAEILKQVESYLVLKLPSAEEVRVGGSSQCDITLAQCQLFGMANIKVLLKQPPPEWLGPYCGGVLSTRSMMTLKELVILRNGTDRWPAVRFKLRMHPQTMVLHIKEVIEKISNAKKRYQRLLNYATEEELFDYSQISQICTMIELRISVQGLSEAAKLCH